MFCFDNDKFIETFSRKLSICLSLFLYNPIYFLFKNGINKLLQFTGKQI